MKSSDQLRVTLAATFRPRNTLYFWFGGPVGSGSSLMSGVFKRTGYSLCTLNGRFHGLKIAIIRRVLCRNSRILIQDR